jgi:hypothetical protein
MALDALYFPDLIEFFGKSFLPICWKDCLDILQQTGWYSNCATLSRSMELFVGVFHLWASFDCVS